MGDLAVGDLYELVAQQQSGSQIDRSSNYQCRFCTNFEIAGSDLCDSDVGRSHAAAHRIAFEALLEPTSFLVCPICDERQYSKEASEAIVFNCMFNDIDLVNHLLNEHGDMLSDELLGDFTDVNYLLTTFKESKTRPPRRSCRDSPLKISNALTDLDNTEQMHSSNHDRNSMERISESASINAGSGPGSSEGALEREDSRESDTQDGSLTKQDDDSASQSRSVPGQLVSDAGESNDDEMEDESSGGPIQSSSSGENIDQQALVNDMGEDQSDEDATTRDQSVDDTVIERIGDDEQIASCSGEADLFVKSPSPQEEAAMVTEETEYSPAGGDGMESADEIGSTGGGLQPDQEQVTPFMTRPPVSRITCMECGWDAAWTSTAMQLRKSIAMHVRSHIREESEERLNDPNVFYAAKRLLCCMDFSLEEYFEKDVLTDLSETVNSGLMEKTYHELLVKLFGISLPLVMRILHGTKGNPFRSAKRRKNGKARVRAKTNANKIIDVIDLVNDSETDAYAYASSDNALHPSLLSGDTENSDSDADGAGDSNDYSFLGLDAENLAFNEHFQCSRPECGHSILPFHDCAVIMRHISAHIRHDEARLQRAVPPIVCDCGMAAYSPAGFLYHIFHDHPFDKKTFRGAAKTVMSFLVLVFDSTVRSCAHEVATSMLSGNKAQVQGRQAAWRAHFCLEGEEGEEAVWSDCSSLNQDWVKLWAGLVEEDSAQSESSKRTVDNDMPNLSVGDVIKLLEMHPFVESVHPPARRRHSYAIADDSKIIRHIKTSWRRLRLWFTGPEAERYRLAPLSRWYQLVDASRLVQKKKTQKNGASADKFNCNFFVSSSQLHMESIVVGVGAPSDHAVADIQQSAANTASQPSDGPLNNLVPSEPSPEQHEREAESSNGNGNIVPSAVDCDELSETIVKADDDDSSPPAVADAHSSGELDKSTAETSTGEQDNIASALARFRQEEPAFEEVDASLVGKVVSCRMCDGFRLPAEEIREQRAHCALHAITEARFLCSLYIHRHSDRPLSCPFCNSDLTMYSPLCFLDHLREGHLQNAVDLYEKFFTRLFPCSQVFTDPVVPEDGNCAEQLETNVFVINCERSHVCKMKEVLRLERKAVISVNQTDVAVLKHMLWHIRNDEGLKMANDERLLMARAVMGRISGRCNVRQIAFMARKALKHWSRLGQYEADVVKFVVKKMNEIGQNIFGPNKGLIFSLVFPRRWVRDQSGLSLYPPCVCRLCVHKELPRYSAARRKRAFVAYAHPVALHILEHLNANELGKLARQHKCVCPLDGTTSRTVSSAVKHVLDCHNEAVEVNAFHLILDAMGVLNVFTNAIDAVLGDQAWQLKEALGFDAFEKIVTERIEFFDKVALEEDSLRDHSIDCPRSRDDVTLLCTCAEPASTSVTIRPPPPTLIKLADGLPSQSQAFYREFLDTGAGSVVPDDLVAPSDHLIEAEAASEELNPFEAAQAVASAESPAPAESSSVQVKLEPAEEVAVEPRSELDRQAEEMPLPSIPQLDIRTMNLSGPPLRMIPPQLSRAQKSRMEKQLREMKRESQMAIPQRNLALPLKNVIQGSRTVAAAVAAALGAAPDAAPVTPLKKSSRIQPNTSTAASSFVKPTVHVGQPATTFPRPPLGKRDTRAADDDIGDEESDLALGTLVKRPRTVVEAPTVPRKSRSKGNKKKKTTIAELLADSTQ